MALPTETPESRRAQAAYSESDIVRCRAWVDSLKGRVKYLDGDKVKTALAEKLKYLWFANEK